MKKNKGRKPYSIREAYWIIVQGLRTAKYMRREKSKGTLDPKFIERIMLAVTEVNGCEMCSYAHTKMALEQGMSLEEIQNMLQGELKSIPNKEIEAVLFAQHYADSRGNPSKSSWNHIVDKYGDKLAYGILGTIRIIMIGNAYGAPMGTFLDRFKKKGSKKNSIIYEITMMMTLILFLPVGIIHAVFSNIFQLKIIKFII